MSVGFSSSGKRTRVRSLPDWRKQVGRGSLHETSYNKSTKVTTEKESIGPTLVLNTGSPSGRQVTVDENHASRLGSFKRFQFTGDVGGEFESTKQAVIAIGGSAHLFRVAEDATVKNVSNYFGPCLATNPGALVPVDPGKQNLDPLGTHAIALVKPTNNVANLATDLVEARQEGLPSLWGVNLWKGKTNLARAAGSEYLNQQFGWAPLVSDIRDASYAAANAHKILASYERNSHKMVRRRYEFPVEKSESTSLFASSVNGWANIPNGMFGPGQLLDSTQTKGNVYKTTRFFRKVWFSGAFTYHLPLGFNSRYKLIRAASQAGPLLGIELTPEVVWNATPWTWALDWVSNIGDCVSIYSDMATDGLVIKYGYVMEHVVQSDTYTFVGFDGYRPAVRNRPGSVVAYFERKRRVKATPFGFEIGWEGLTPRQLAISAALGITRIL